MVYRFLWFFAFLVLPLHSISPQQILDGAQFLYAAVKNHGGNNTGKDADAILKSHSKVYGNKVKLLKQAREIAKEKNDTGAVQNLTERIIEGQKSFWQRYPKICTGVLIGLCSYASFRFGRYIEKPQWDPGWEPL